MRTIAVLLIAVLLAGCAHHRGAGYGARASGHGHMARAGHHR